MVKIQTILCEADREKVSQAVALAEEKTSGEIVVSVVAASDDYPAAHWRLGVLLALVCGFVVFSFFPDTEPLVFLGSQILCFVAGWFLAGIAPLTRLLLFQDELEEETRQRAVEAFFTQSLHATRDRTGVLILVSLLEHRVVVLADTGINAKVPVGTWDHVVRDLTAAIRAGSLVEGLTLAVAECGAQLASFFPRKADDTNELANRPI